MTLTGAETNRIEAEGNVMASLAERASMLAARDADMDRPFVTLTPASDIKCVPIRWLWKGWLARGKLHVLAGAPGTGKTTIALALAATITRGGCWPDGTVAPAGRVLVWSGEDDPADTLVPRLRAAGADLRNVLVVGDTVTDGEPRAFDPAADLGALEWQAQEFGNIALLIADPVVSAVAGDSHKNTEVRRALQPLVNLGHRLDCAVLGISHFSKGTAGRDPTERVTGSVAFGALARLVLVTAKGEDGDRLLARAKSNIGPDGGGYGYDLELTEIEGMEASRVRWGSPLEGTARELLGVADSVPDSSLDDASDWLLGMLSGTEIAVAELKKQAAAAGFSWRTMERSKSSIGAQAERVSDGNSGAGRWVWKLPRNTATGNTANPTTDFGGLAEKQLDQGSPVSQGRKAANSESGGVVADLRGDDWEEEA